MMKNSVLLAVVAMVNGAFASSPGTPIVYDYPLDNSDIGENTREITLKWHIEQKSVPSWEVEVWCASDAKLLYRGEYKPVDGAMTNELKVTGFEPNRVYYARVARNWVRRQECIFTTGKIPAEKAAEIGKPFLDPARYDIVDMRGEAYDVGLTRFRGFTRGVYTDRRSPTSFIRTVPCEMYSRAYVIYRLDDSAEKDPAFNFRLTRYVSAPWKKFKGRAQESMVNMLVDVKKRTTKQEGGQEVLARVDRYGVYGLVEVPLDMGDIQDILFTDDKGDFEELKDELAAKGLKRYLDLEIMGRTPDWRSSFEDPRCDTDHNAPASGVTVYGIVLEKVGAEFETKCVEPGNIFANDEDPEGIAVVRLKTPGEYTLSLEAFDVDGKKVGEVSKPVTESGEYKLSFPLQPSTLSPQPLPGWYRLVWRLVNAHGVAITCHASAAVLGKDTRTTEMGEQYGTWIGLSRWGSHYSPKPDSDYNIHYTCSILQKAGFRRSFDIGYLPLETRRKYRLGEANAARFPQDWDFIYKKKGEQALVDEIRRRIGENPKCLVATLYHEHAKKHGVAPEAFGLEPDERFKDIGREQVAPAIEMSAFMRKHFPEVKINLGNSLTASEFVAELIRHGLPEGAADYMGLEVMGNEIMPEYGVYGGLQSAEQFRATAKHFGYKWGVDQCFESNFRQDLVIGAEMQASYYVRDILLGWIWGFPSIWIGAQADCGNHYNNSSWGNDGFCTRWPFMYPKKSYVAVATATKMLDRVRGVKKIDTGDNCVNTVEFAREDGRAVTAFWSTRGEIKVKVKGEGEERWELSDMYGRAMAFDGKLTVSPRVMYILSEPGAVRFVNIVTRAYPDDQAPADYRALAKCENAADWRLATGPVTPGPENQFMVRGWPHRTWTPAAVKEVDDPEMGRCLEFELPDDGKSISPMHYRYDCLMLKKPVKIGADFKSIGAWVKGNSGWGEIGYILEDSKDQRTYSGDTGSQGQMDLDGRSVVDYTGWKFVCRPVKDGSSVHETKCAKPTWHWSNKHVAQDPEVKLVGIFFAARMQPLYLDETKPCRQVIRVKSIGVFD
ncbi:MAG: hypothetical protein PHV28_11085 [Kiritimatiellae bacterium]|nr:hypothetical protein [Kiritimatiellia bacterium]